jgi:sterol desaturase/sphingolipid hydroxylase (fatty acid hydroxylase superfamily)
MKRRSSSARVAGAALVLAEVAGLLVLERRRPLRLAVKDGRWHDLRNLTMAALGGVSLALAQSPLVTPLLRAGERRRWGLLRAARLPPALADVAAIVLLDYTQYVWHRLTHEVPFLWRFHEVHHLDRSLTATTGVRFHPGELLLAVPFRALQVVVLGVSPRALELWQLLTTAQILFHHANVRLPVRLERALCTVLVTPRMHGIHHSLVRAETDANWGTLLSLFDRLHGTLRLNVPSRAITIGIPAYAKDADGTLVRSLALPFRHHLRAWTRPGQIAPTRGRLTLPRDELAD